MAVSLTALAVVDAVSEEVARFASSLKGCEEVLDQGREEAAAEMLALLAGSTFDA